MKPCPPTWLYNWYYRLIFVLHYGHFRPKKYFQHPRKRSQLISIPTVKNSDLNTENIRWHGNSVTLDLPGKSCNNTITKQCTMRLENPLIKLSILHSSKLCKVHKNFLVQKNERMRQGRGSIASSHKFKRQTLPR